MAALGSSSPAVKEAESGLWLQQLRALQAGAAHEVRRTAAPGLPYGLFGAWADDGAPGAALDSNSNSNLKSDLNSNYTQQPGAGAGARGAGFMAAWDKVVRLPPRGSAPPAAPAAAAPPTATAAAVATVDASAAAAAAAPAGASASADAAAAAPAPPAAAAGGVFEQLWMLEADEEEEVAQPAAAAGAADTTAAAKVRWCWVVVSLTNRVFLIHTSHRIALVITFLLLVCVPEKHLEGASDPGMKWAGSPSAKRWDRAFAAQPLGCLPLQSARPAFARF